MEFKDKDVEFKHLIDTIHTYLPQAKCDDVTKAYNLAEEAHKAASAGNRISCIPWPSPRYWQI